MVGPADCRQGRADRHESAPFHVSFIRLDVSGGGRTEKVSEVAMLGPFSSRHYKLNETKAVPGLQVVFAAINDYGGYSQPLTATATLTD